MGVKQNHFVQTDMLSCDSCLVAIKRHYDLTAFYRLTSEPIVRAIIVNGTPGAADFGPKFRLRQNHTRFLLGVIDRYRCYLRPVTVKMIRQIIPRRIHTVHQTGGRGVLLISEPIDFRSVCVPRAPGRPRRFRQPLVHPRPRG